MGKTIVDWLAAKGITRGRALESDTGFKIGLGARQVVRTASGLLSSYQSPELLRENSTACCDCRALT